MKSNDITQAQAPQQFFSVSLSARQSNAPNLENSMTPEKNDATVLLRLPSSLKAALEREAYANGRRITAEINMRLTATLNAQGYGQDGRSLYVVGEFHPVRAEEPRPTGGKAAEREKALVDAIRRLPAEKQLALLALLK